MNAPKLPAPLADAPRIGDWLALDGAGRVTVLSGRVELGQGNLTAIVQMAADELGCAPEAVGIQSAHTGRTPNEGFTAGSVSITLGGASVRWAASALRRVALEAAVEKLGCAADDLDLAHGKILRDGAETGLTLASLAGALDLSQPVADRGAPRAAPARRLSGISVPRFELPERITGAPFIHDLRLPGTLFGRPVHPPTMASVLKSLDLDALRARPGVVEVVRDGSFVGIVAETELAANAAARWAHAHAEWSDVTPHPNDPLRTIADSEEPAEVVHSEGGSAPAAGTEYETTVLRPYLFHGSIGPASAAAVWEDGALTVYSQTQGVFPLRGALAQVFKVEAEKITVIHHPGAGCYGHNGADDAALDAALMARAVPGRPVHVVWSRLDEFRSAPMGPGMATTAHATLGADKRIQSMHLVVNSAPHAHRPGVGGSPNLRAAAYLATPIPPNPSRDLPMARGGGADRNAVPLYAIPNVEVTKRIVHSLPYRTSSLRSLGAFTNIYAIETLMDEIAHDIGEDPFDFRLRHLDDARARAVIERLREDAADILGQALPEGEGWGLGFARYKNTAAYCAVLARISVDEEVRVTDVRAVVEMGETVNPDGAVNQIEGGIVQSISWTLKEAVSFEGARVAPETWLDYPILRFSEVPEVRVSLIDRPDLPPLGCAEAAQGPTAAALGNAVRSAMGVTVRELPLTRDRIISALL